MMSQRLGSWASLLFCALAACTGEQGPPGDPGQKGDPGDPGTPAPTTGTLTGTITDGVKGDALAGVAIVAQDLGGAQLATATTAADGTFGLTLTAGPVDLVLARASYTSPGTIHTGVGVGQTVHVAITMNESASGKPSVALSAPTDDVGYGATVALTATASDPNGDPLTYAWKNTTWPVIGAVDNAGNVTMPTMAQAFAFRPDANDPGKYISGYVIPDRLGVLPILPDTRGQVTISLTVADGRGQSASTSLTLDAASIATSTENVALHQRVYLNSGHAGQSAWTVTSAPASSIATFDDPTSRTPSFTPDRVGTYTLAEGGKWITLYAGTWRGMIAGGSGNSVTVDTMCTTCHGAQFPNAPGDQFTPWAGTAHATMFTRGINGVASNHYAGSCVGCHTVGYDTGVASNGFDDVAGDWAMPVTMEPGNWDLLVTEAPQVARLANIQCESCHGPQDSEAHIKTWDANQQSAPFLSPRISYSAELCATCHAAADHHIYSDWSQSSGPELNGEIMGHASRAGALLGAGATGLSASCGRCHAAQGYMLFSDLLTKGKIALTSIPSAKLAQVTSANVEPVTCTACHDPHDASNPNQLRFYGDTPNLPSGFAGYGMGKGALCLTCHNSRNGAQSGSDALTYLHEDGEPYNSGNPTGYSAPHQAAQGDVFTGHNAYFMGAQMPMLSRHAAVEDTCVGCHMTLQPKGYLSHGAPAKSGHLFRIADEDIGALCANCHGATVNGEGIQANVEAQLAQLATSMGGAVKAKMNGLATTGGVRVRAWDPATDLYSSSSGSTVVLDLAGNPITSVGVSEIHGQIGFIVNFATPIQITFTDGSTKGMTSFGVQMGDFKDGATGKTSIYALSGNLVRAGWNYFLVEGDQSKGLHNPSFVQAVMTTTLHKDLSF